MRRPARLPRNGALSALIALVASSAGAAFDPAPLSAQSWDPEERVLVTDFQRVTALARSPDRLFAATDGGLVVMSDAFRRWELPMTREDGYPDSQVLALAWDQRDATLWMSTRDGRLLQLDLFRRRFVDDVPLTGVGGAVDRMVAGRDASVIYLRRGNRWQAFDPFTRRLQVASEAEVRRAIESDFDLNARAELLGDARFQSEQAFLGRRGTRKYEVTDVMPSSGGIGEFWVSTYGGFLERYDSFSGQSEPVPYGVIGIGAGAVMVDGDDVWFAPRYPTDRYGVARADLDLEDWSAWSEADFGFAGRDAPDEPIHVLLSTGDDIWAGGERGLYRFDGASWHREPLSSRAGGSPIRALAMGPGGLDGVWVGTDRGLFRVSVAGRGPDIELLDWSRVSALQALDRDLWVGTDGGLVLVRAGEDGAPVGGVTGPPGRVGALATDGERLFVGIDRDVWVLDPETASDREDERVFGGNWSRAAPLGAIASRVTALAVRDGVVWIGSDEGFTSWDTRDDLVTPYSFAAGDLPMGPRNERGVSGLALDEDGGVWAATPAGALRLLPRR